MSLFDKKQITTLAPVKGIAADKITPEQLAAINAEFAELGYEGIEVSATGTLATAANNLKNAMDANAVQADVVKKNTEAITAKDARIAELEAENKKLGGKGAAEPTPGGTDDDEIITEKTTKEFEFEGSASEKAIKEFFN